jgi:hypothetical protein
MMQLGPLQWKTILPRLSVEEKNEIKSALFARSLDPQVFVIDETLLSPELLARLWRELGYKVIPDVTTVVPR